MTNGTKKTKTGQNKQPVVGTKKTQTGQKNRHSGQNKKLNSGQKKQHQCVVCVLLWWGVVCCALLCVVFCAFSPLSTGPPLRRTTLFVTAPPQDRFRRTPLCVSAVYVWSKICVLPRPSSPDRGRRGSHTTAREPKRAHFRAPALQRHPERHRKSETVAGREKKARNFGPPTLRAPPFGAPPLGPHPSGPHPSGPHFF